MTLFLGTITGVRAGTAKGERGRLGLSTRVAIWSSDRERPVPSPTDRPAPDDAERLWVMSVDVDGAADWAGIAPGDEIVAIDGQGVAGLGARTAAVLLAPQNLRAGQDVGIEIDRDGSAQTITVRAAAPPADASK